MAKQNKIIIPWDNPKKWLCTFNDLMTLLLTFFVLILTMSSLDAKSVKEVSQQMLNALGVMEAGSLHEETIVDRLINLENIGKKMKIFKNLASPVKDGVEIKDREVFDQPVEVDKDFVIIQEEGKPEPDKKEVEFIYNQFKQIAYKDYYEPGITVVKQKRGVVLRLEDSILFEPGSSALKPEAFPLLKKVSRITNQTKLNVCIEGHTDSTKIQNNEFSSNWQLSVARAVSVLKYMTGTEAVSPERFSVSGYADMLPLQPNTTPENRQKNRRVEITLTQN